MRTLYLDCGMGAAGDMLTAALSELLPDQDAFFEKMNALGIPGVHFEKEKTQKCGITGTHSKVTVNGEEEESLDVHHHDHDHHHDHEDHHHDREDHDHDHEDHHHDHDQAHGEHHHHSSLNDIEHIVRDHLPVSDRVKDDIMAVYQLIAPAESAAHGVPDDKIHFTSSDFGEPICFTPIYSPLVVCGSGTRFICIELLVSLEYSFVN